MRLINRTGIFATKQTGSADNTLPIRDCASLQAWRQQLRTLTWTSNLPALLFQLPELSYEQNQSISALANEYRKKCGCSSGGFVMSAAAVAMVTSYFLSGHRVSGISLTHLVNFVVLNALAALSGKFLGLLWARLQLLRLAGSVYDAANAGQHTIR